MGHGPSSDSEGIYLSNPGQIKILLSDAHWKQEFQQILFTDAMIVSSHVFAIGRPRRSDPLIEAQRNLLRLFRREPFGWSSKTTLMESNECDECRSCPSIFQPSVPSFPNNTLCHVLNAGLYLRVRQHEIAANPI